mmetsp:Transcript_22526/g.52430  ORF Transcript_22526/g.52430 Transcript_22526/m.52430 type:complete len:662 (+) Transcript_22526:109-2094(+)
MLASNVKVASTLATLTDHTAMADVGDTSQPKQRMQWTSLLNHNRAMASQVSWTSHEAFAVGSHTQIFEIAVSALIFFNLGLVIRETDLAARGEDEPMWLWVLNFALVIIFFLEVLVRLCVYRSALLRDWTNVLDVALVVADVALGTYTVVNRLAHDDSDKGVATISALRVFRSSVRVARALRTASVFSQVNVLMQGFLKALETIFWGLLMIGLILIIWSVLAVQLLHPVVKDSQYLDGDYLRHFESVWRSSLTLFGFALFGDGWSGMISPLVREEGWPVAFFLGVLISVTFAMLNLILSAIVDNAATARVQETHMEAIALDQRLRTGKRLLVDTCRAMDIDESGKLSPEELRLGMQKRPDFMTALKKMDIDTADLETVFRLLDVENHAEVRYESLADQLHRVKSQGMRSMESALTLSIVSDLRKQVAELQNLMSRAAQSNDDTDKGKGSAPTDGEGHEGSRKADHVQFAKPRRSDVYGDGSFSMDSLQSAADQLLAKAERLGATSTLKAVEDAVWQSMSAKGYSPSWQPRYGEAGVAGTPQTGGQPQLMRVVTSSKSGALTSTKSGALSTLQQRVLFAAGLFDSTDEVLVEEQDESTCQPSGEVLPDSDSPEKMRETSSSASALRAAAQQNMSAHSSISIAADLPGMLPDVSEYSLEDAEP